MTGVTFQSLMYELIRSLHTVAANIFQPIITKEGLTQKQAELLFELWQCDGELTVGRIQCLNSESSGNRSTLCKRLEQKGLLQRVRSSKDERYVTLHLTEQGCETVHRMEQQIEHCCAPVLQKIEEAEIEAFQQGVRRLIQITERLESCEIERNI